MVEKRISFGRIIKKFKKHPESPYGHEIDIIKTRSQDLLNTATSQYEILDGVSQVKSEVIALVVEKFDQATDPEERSHTLETLEASCEELRILFQRSDKEADRSAYIAYARLIQGLKNMWFPPSQQ